MQYVEKSVDFGIHNRLPDKGERAMLNMVCFLQPLRKDPRGPAELFNHVIVMLHRPIDDELGIVHLPTPLGPDWIRVVPPAEHALVGASQRRGGLHAAV